MASNNTDRAAGATLLRLGAIAGAVMAVIGLITYLSGLVWPSPRVLLSVSNWQSHGPTSDGRYRYTFDLNLRNFGNVPVSMSPGESRVVRVCANVNARRQSEVSPLVRLIRHPSVTMVDVRSMDNNVLQLGIRRLPLPLLSTETIKNVEITSSKHDLGGVRLFSSDPLLSPFLIDSATEAQCAN